MYHPEIFLNIIHTFRKFSFVKNYLKVLVKIEVTAMEKVVIQINFSQFAQAPTTFLLKSDKFENRKSKSKVQGELCVCREYFHIKQKFYNLRRCICI